MYESLPNLSTHEINQKDDKDKGRAGIILQKLLEIPTPPVIPAEIKSGKHVGMKVIVIIQ